MHKKEYSRIERSMALSSPGGLTLSARSRALALFLALSITVFEVAAQAQVDCFNLCQQQLALCLQQEEGEPPSEVDCQDRYDACIEDCLSQ
jgi:hypothetical protein